jgi:predicted dehydrogenase
MNEPVRICAVGLSDYLRRYALPGLMRAAGCQLTAIAVRDALKTKRALGDVPVELLPSYAEALRRPDIDAVYIMLPNALHFEWVIQAVEAGKHVLCEKPMAMSVDDVRTIADAARSRGVHVIEGYMFRFHPQWQEVASMIQSGKIGKVRSVIAHYAYLDEQLTDARFAPGSAGGALRLVGCYAVAAARLAFGTEPIWASGVARYHVPADIDLTFSGILEFEAGHATVQASVETFDTQYVRITGEGGMIELRPLPWNPAASDTTNIELTLPAGSDLITIPAVDQFQLEFENFARVVKNFDEPLVSLSESMLNTAAVESLRDSALRDGARIQVASLIRP